MSKRINKYTHTQARQEEEEGMCLFIVTPFIHSFIHYFQIYIVNS